MTTKHDKGWTPYGGGTVPRVPGMGKGRVVLAVLASVGVHGCTMGYLRDVLLAYLSATTDGTGASAPVKCKRLSPANTAAGRARIASDTDGTAWVAQWCDRSWLPKVLSGQYLTRTSDVLLRLDGPQAVLDALARDGRAVLGTVRKSGAHVSGPRVLPAKRVPYVPPRRKATTAQRD